MGQRGPAPAPAKLKVLRGEDHKARIARAPQPKSAPDKPAGMTPEGAAVWDRVMAAIADTQHIGQAHADTFRTYCEVTARLFAHVDPMSREWRDLANSHRQLARELCLTPATGANLQAVVKDVRKLDRFLA